MGKRFYILVFCMLICISGGVVWASSEAIPVVTEIYPTGAVNPVGLAWDGAFFWTIDTKRDRIFKLHPRNLRLMSSHAVLSSQLSNISFDGTNFFTVEKETNVVFRFDHGSLSPSLIMKLDILQGEELLDIAFRDDQYWLLTKTPDGVHISVTDNLSESPSQSYELPGTDTAGITWAGDFLWYAENSTGFIYRYVLGDRLLLVDKYLSPTRDMSGLVYLDGDLWVLEKETGNIVQLKIHKSASKKIFTSFFINDNGWATNLVLQNSLVTKSRLNIFVYNSEGDPVRVFRNVVIPGNGVRIFPAKLYGHGLAFGNIKVVVLEGKIAGTTIKIDPETDSVFSDPLQ